jgi:hypothetical protein
VIERHEPKYVTCTGTEGGHMKGSCAVGFITQINRQRENKKTAGVCTRAHASEDGWVTPNNPNKVTGVLSFVPLGLSVADEIKRLVQHRRLFNASQKHLGKGGEINKLINLLNN